MKTFGCFCRIISLVIITNISYNIYGKYSVEIFTFVFYQFFYLGQPFKSIFTFLMPI
jgi:hypothetical protein